MVVCVDSQFTANEAYIISVKDIISSSLSLNLHVGKSYVQNVLKGFERDVILKILAGTDEPETTQHTECRGFGRSIRRVLTPL